MGKELVSVIIPVYKENNEYLKECIESVINQTYKNIEIIIVNDGMTSENLKLVDIYVSRYSYIRIIGDKNEGVSVARNKGILASTGDWITFLDSDDYIEKNYVEKMLSKTFEFYDVQCVMCGYYMVYNQRRETRVLSKDNDISDSKSALLKILDVQSGYGFSNMKIWNAKYIKENNFRFNSSLTVAEDSLFCMECSEKIHKMVYISEPLYNYRFNNQSVVRKYDADYVKKYLNAMLEVNKYLEKFNDVEISKKFYNYVAYHIFLIVINYCFHPQNERRGIKLLKEICEIEIFKNAIKFASYEGFSLTRKITLFTLKWKMYLVTDLIARFRQIQFKK